MTKLVLLPLALSISKFFKFISYHNTSTMSSSVERKKGVVRTFHIKKHSGEEEVVTIHHRTNPKDKLLVIRAPCESRESVMDDSEGEGFGEINWDEKGCAMCHTKDVTFGAWIDGKHTELCGSCLQKSNMIGCGSCEIFSTHAIVVCPNPKCKRHSAAAALEDSFQPGQTMFNFISGEVLFDIDQDLPETEEGHGTYEGVGTTKETRDIFGLFFQDRFRQRAVATLVPWTGERPSQSKDFSAFMAEHLSKHIQGRKMLMSKMITAFWMAHELKKLGLREDILVLDAILKHFLNYIADMEDEKEVVYCAVAQVNACRKIAADIGHTF